MIAFLTYLIVAFLGFFLVLPYLRIRTNWLDDIFTDKDEAYILGGVTCLVWPIMLGFVVALCFLYPIWKLSVFAISSIEKAMEKKPIPVVVSELPEVNGAKSGYRNVEYKYDSRKEY